MNEVAREPIMIGQRLAGIGTSLVGLLALYGCSTFIQDIWNTPSRNFGIGVVVGSILMIVLGIVIGFPDRLPKQLSALSMLLFGVCSVVFGTSILLWFLYNLLVARQPEFRAGPSIALVMVPVGFGLIAKGYSKLRNVQESSP